MLHRRLRGDGPGGLRRHRAGQSRAGSSRSTSARCGSTRGTAGSRRSRTPGPRTCRSCSRPTATPYAGTRQASACCEWPLRAHGPGPGEGTLMSTQLPAHADVVVIGGGVMGLSTAYHLAAAGVRDVLLVEQDELGSGSTSKAAGGVRAQFSDAVNIELGLRSLHAFDRFARALRAGDRPAPGRLPVPARRPEHVAAFEANVALQNELGVPSRMIDVAEAKRAVAADRHPTDCSRRRGPPTTATARRSPSSSGYAGAARRAGARLLTELRGHWHRGRRRPSGRAHRCRGRSGPTRSSALPAPGRGQSATWPGSTCRWSRCAARSSPPEPCPARHATPRSPSTSRTSLYFHREGPGLLLGMSDPDETPGFKLGRSDDWLPRLTAAMERRAPALARRRASSAAGPDSTR